MRRFRYCGDPVFLCAVALYALNRFVARPLAAGHTAFFADYGSDLLCIPFWLPPCLRAYRAIGARDHDGPPTRFELIVHVAVWSLWFEWLGPRIAGPFWWMVADPWDVVAYAAGALVAGAFWGSWRAPVRRAREREEVAA